MKPLCVDLFCGLFGWSSAFIAEGYRCVGFDLQDMHAQFGLPRPAEVELVLQDVLTLHGSQFRDAAVIVASPPCQKYSYMAMPWTRAKKLAAWYREKPIRITDLNTLYDACFRIQREASEAAGHHIPMVVENVKGAQPWVGRAKWHYGSFYLWGDVPALMPHTFSRKSKGSSPGKLWEARPRESQWSGSHGITDGTKNNGGSWFNIAHNTESGTGQNPDGRKGNGKGWFSDLREDGSRPDWKESGCVTRLFNSKSPARKAASAAIAKIPPPLARHIAQVYKP